MEATVIKLNRRWRFLVRLNLLLMSHAFAGAATARAQVVRAVLFFSPTCPHCHQVINQDLPVFFGIYGGQPRTWFDETMPESERFLYLFTNGQLEILLIDASRPGGYAIFNSSFVSHPVDLQVRGVPRLIIDQTVLIGDVEIPQRLHDHIRRGLAAGGIDWPPIDGLAAAVAAIPATAWVVAGAAEEAAAQDSTQPVAGEPIADSVPPQAAAAVADSVAAGDTTARAVAVPTPAEPRAPGERDTVPDVAVDSATPEPTGTSDSASADSGTIEPTRSSQQAADTPPESLSAIQRAFESIPVRRPTMRENFLRDPAGNTMSVLALIGMVASILVLPRLVRSRSTNPTLSVAVPVIALIGIVAASYLTYIEATDTPAVCGPVGDCNTVQQSEYAVLFGIIPVGLLGLVGYLMMIGAWSAARFGSDSLAAWAKVSLLVMAALGTVFSIYLTFLEPFVIGASCMWCLTSAVIVTLIMLLAAGPAAEAFGRIKRGEGW